jgi:hypothetical protein
MENIFAKYEGISGRWIEKCTFISGIVAMAQEEPTVILLANHLRQIEAE